MSYVTADGSILQRRSWFRLSLISDFFWGIINGVGLFFHTLINPRASVAKGKYMKRNNTYNGSKQANIKSLPSKKVDNGCATGG